MKKEAVYNSELFKCIDTKLTREIIVLSVSITGSVECLLTSVSKLLITSLTSRFVKHDHTNRVMKITRWQC